MIIPEDIPPRLEPDGQPGPYATSGLRTVTGTLMNPLSRKMWYNERIGQISSMASPVLNAYHPQVSEFMQLVGGLDPWWRTEQAPPEEWPLSRVVPRVKLGPNFPEWEIPRGTYWIDYETVTASTSKLPQAQWIEGLRERFPEGSTLILGNIGKLGSRLALWQFRKEIWSHPLIAEVDAVVCPDFSSYLDDPYPHGAVAERMTQIFVDMGYEAGKTTIPIVSWQNREALKRQADYLCAMYPKVHTIYIELLAREVDRRSWLFTRFDDIEAVFGDMPFRYLISGLDAGWAVREARERWPNGNFSLISIWPWMKTSFSPGTKVQKARSFRRFVHQFEEWHRGEGLPEAKSRPTKMTILLWEKEEEERLEAEAKAKAQAAKELAEEAEETPTPHTAHEQSEASDR